MLMQAKSEVRCCLCRVQYLVCLTVGESGFRQNQEAEEGLGHADASQVLGEVLFM